MRTSPSFLTVLMFFCLMEIQANPDAAQILRDARVNQVQQEASLQAKLRGRGLNEPFRIILEGGVIRYEFANPQESILLELTESGARLAEQKGGRESPVRGARFDTKVRDSAITYEDLSMRFLYWPVAKYLGEEMIRTRLAYRIEVHPGTRKDSVYGAARLWVDKATGALLRMEGYDWEGKLTKRFEVVGVQRIEGQWFLRTMRIENLDPESRKVLDRTYLDVLEVEQPHASLPGQRQACGGRFPIAKSVKRPYS
jgi:hypothetical protein